MKEIIDNFSFGIHLNNCKIELELNWARDFVMSHNAEETKFNITNSRFYFVTVTLST